MRIFFVNGHAETAQALRDAGAEVHAFNPGGGIFHLPGILEKRGFTPDLVVQEESLGIRSFLSGLEHMNCPTLFSAVDSHLNMFWHRWYGRLFDAVLTPHVSLFRALPEAVRPPSLHRFSRPGEKRAFKPHAGREHFMSMCGRLTEHRHTRRWLLELLKPLGLHHADGLSFSDMLRLYDNSVAVPNESIGMEVNFRLMEAASSGAVCISPDIGEDQNALFEPDKEFLIYRDGEELLHLLDFARKKPAAAEKIGRAAAARTAAEHLPRHRAETLLALGRSTSRNRLSGPCAQAAFWLSVASRIRGGAMPLPAREQAREGLGIAQKRLDAGGPFTPFEQNLLPAVLVQCLALLHEHANGAAEAKDLASRLSALVFRRDFELSFMAEDPKLPAALSAHALRNGNFSEALRFWSLFSGPAAPPRTPEELAASWGDILQRHGPADFPGHPFAEKGPDLPDSALEFMLAAHALAPENTQILKKLVRMMGGIPALRPPYLAYLLQLYLRNPADWRVRQDYAAACLRVCRVAEGRAEMDMAGKAAEAQGQAAVFAARLEITMQKIRS